MDDIARFDGREFRKPPLAKLATLGENVQDGVLGLQSVRPPRETQTTSAA